MSESSLPPESNHATLEEQRSFLLSRLDGIKVTSTSSSTNNPTMDSKPPPFRRFTWVIPDNLARSSSPHYHTRDSDQNMDDTAIAFLVAQGIKQVISLNTIQLPESAISTLHGHGITYVHSPIPDFGAPSIAQLREIHQVSCVEGKQPSLVYCGYGHGRTGTVISALQILRGRRFAGEDEVRENFVEADGQFAVLAELQREVFGEGVRGLG